MATVAMVASACSGAVPRLLTPHDWVVRENVAGIAKVMSATVLSFLVTTNDAYGRTTLGGQWNLR